ncbi:MAG: hypothetical protein ACRENK_08070 [Gemmatimonadaceae bacterium]
MTLESPDTYGLWVTDVAIRAVSGPLPTTGSWGWLGSFAIWLRAAVRSPTEHELVDVIERAAEQFGAPVLEAKDGQDLDARIDAAVEHPNLLRFNVAISKLLTFDAVARVARERPTGPAPGFVEALGAGPALVLSRAHELEAATASAIAQLLMQLGPRAVDAVRELEDRELHILYESSVPSKVQQALFDGLRSVVASLALAHAVVRRFKGVELERWLAQRLVEIYQEGLFEYLRLLASMPGIIVSPRIVPPAKRFNVQQLCAEHERALRAIDSSVVDGGELFLSDVTDDDA